MRVRGFWPLCPDRAITLPIPFAAWIDSPVQGGGVGVGAGAGAGAGAGDGHHLRSRGPVPGSSTSGKVFIPTNPFANPVALQALKDSFVKQPNWKAAVMEGTTWQGNADENAAKWRRLNHLDG
jgi:hypothetical protein